MKASHVLHVELATRISTQRLHYRAGDEETAAVSLHSLFQTTRNLMVDHPEEAEFQATALIFLNEILRPYTARWHGWMTQNGDETDAEGRPILKLRDECVRRKFREELRELQPLLHGARKTFGAISEGKTPEKGWLNPAMDSPEYAGLLAEINSGTLSSLAGKPLRSELRPQVPICAAGEDGKLPERPIHCAIQAAEHRHIIARRRAMAQNDTKKDGRIEGTGEAKKSAESENSDVIDAFGLALSGGGIRSATFCLGVVQALHKRGLFRQVDYLSTVSGGGYLGTFLTSYLGQQDKPGNLDLPSDPDERLKEVFGPSLKNCSGESSTLTAEPPALRHLRNNSKYLLNGGPLAILHIIAVFLNGVFATFLMLLSLPLVLAWMVREVKESGSDLPDYLHRFIEWLPDGVKNLKIFDQPGSGLLAFLLILTLLLAILRPFAQRLADGKPWKSRWITTRQVIENSGNLAAFATLLTALLCASYIWLDTYGDFLCILPDFKLFKHLPVPTEAAVAAISALIPTLLGLFSNRKDGTARKWVSVLFLLTGPLFFLITFTIIANRLGVGANVETDINLNIWRVVTVLLLLWMFVALNINTISLHRYYRERLCECYLAVSDSTEIGLVKRGIESFLHGSCPDRNRNSTRIGTAKSTPLSEAGKSTSVPYHLISAVINASASRNPELRGRNGDFFLFSRAYCGSPLTGYLPTRQMEKANPGIDLGAAMAISGAAVSTNMGSISNRKHRFMMTLFNVRLGYWMRRPGLRSLGRMVLKSWWKPILRVLRHPWLKWLHCSAVEKLSRRVFKKSRALVLKMYCPRISRSVHRMFSGPGPLYFFREMTGLLTERTHYINLSDGGHIENLAAYELLRRQCKFILCVDAGMEPGMECADLMRLQRLAEIDFGLRMHFDPTDLMPLPTHYSRAYGVLVKIDYAPEKAKAGRETSDQLGWMLYLKLAVTGTEPRHVLDYRRQNPAFPHQTTNDQFYDEAQFEAYRSLGQCAASSLFREEIIGKDNVGEELNVKQWFDLLGHSLLVDNDEALQSKRSF